MNRALVFPVILILTIVCASAFSLPALRAEEGEESEILASIEAAQDESVEEPPVEEVPVGEPSVEVGSGESQSLPEFVSEPLPAAEPPRRVVGDVEVDPDAYHFCSAADFRLSVPEGSITSTFVDLRGGFGSGSRSLSIGSLPAGLDVSFVTAGYDMDVEGETDRVEIVARRTASAGQASFTIPLIYSVFEGDATSTAICQINVLPE